VRRNALEWAVLVASVAAIVVLVGVLVMEGLAENRPADPSIQLRPDEARQAQAGWVIPAEATNAGDEAAVAVVFEATAEVDGEQESSEIEIDFLPAATTVEVGFAFSAEPDGDVSVRLVGFRLP
jgi:uncharacterized protein (TIGR02588 family)